MDLKFTFCKLLTASLFKRLVHRLDKSDGISMFKFYAACKIILYDPIKIKQIIMKLGLGKQDMKLWHTLPLFFEVFVQSISVLSFH